MKSFILAFALLLVASVAEAGWGWGYSRFRAQQFNHHNNVQQFRSQQFHHGNVQQFRGYGVQQFNHGHQRVIVDQFGRLIIVR